MEPSQDPFEKKDPSAQSLNELLSLLLKLNAKLREKMYPPKKKETMPGQTDVVIIIMTNQEDRSPNGSFAKLENPEFFSGDWMKQMFAQIEGVPVRRRKKP
jgi:hypothetical protein